MVDAQNCASELADDILGELERTPSEALCEATGQLLEKVMDVLVTRWRTLETLEDMASRLRELCQLLLENGAHIWPRFPLDAECLARLMQGVIPALSDNDMATTNAAPESRAIITVLGSDRPGIVAAVAGALSERSANILDISQTILQGIFTMTMLVDFGDADFSELKARLDELSESLGVQIVMQREEVFKYMYRL